MLALRQRRSCAHQLVSSLQQFCMLCATEGTTLHADIGKAVVRTYGDVACGAFIFARIAFLAHQVLPLLRRISWGVVHCSWG